MDFKSLMCGSICKTNKGLTVPGLLCHIPEYIQRVMKGPTTHSPLWEL